MFIAVLFVIAKNWKQLKCPLTGEGINKLLYIRTMEYHSVLKGNELLIHAAAQMNLKTTMLRHIR